MTSGPKPRHRPGPSLRTGRPAGRSSGVASEGRAGAGLETLDSAGCRYNVYRRHRRQFILIYNNIYKVIYCLIVRAPPWCRRPLFSGHELEDQKPDRDCYKHTPAMCSRLCILDSFYPGLGYTTDFRCLGQAKRRGRPASCREGFGGGARGSLTLPSEAHRKSFLGQAAA